MLHVCGAARVSFGVRLHGMLHYENPTPDSGCVADDDIWLRLDTSNS